MANHNNSGPGQRSPDEDRASWTPNDTENRSDERDRARGDRSTGVYRGMGGHRGKGPQNWQRSDERILESVNEALTDHDHIDATHIEVTVAAGEVTLSGTVEDRATKRLAEDCVEQILGVKEVQNHIRLQRNVGRGTSPEGNSRIASTAPPAISDRKPRA